MVRGVPFLVIAFLVACPAHGQRCVLRGQTSSPVEVDVTLDSSRDTDGFSLSVVDTPLAIRSRRTSTYALEVIGPLRFTGRTSWLPLALTTSRTLADGVVRITATTEITRVRGLGGGWVFDAIVGGELSVRGLWVPCDALELTEEPNRRSTGGSPPDTRVFTRLTRRDAVFRARPGEGRAAVVRLLASDVTFAVLAHRDGWTRLAWSAEDGARIVGWVEDRSIRRVAGSTGVFSSSVSCAGGCGTHDHIRVAGEFVGRVRIRDGADVFSAAEGTRWARVATATTARVLRVGSDPWVRVLRFDGLSEGAGCELSHAWVRAGDVDFET